MANVSPFKGWRYNPENIGNIEDVFVPPYDVITPDEQQQYYRKSPHNYIRINLNNTPGSERYFSAANTLNMWIGSGILLEEDQSAIYVLSQSFELNGTMVNRVGCICSLELSELGDTVLPHEQTIDKHLDDRYDLMKSTKANSGQIFMCYKDDDMILEKIYNNIKSEPSIKVDLDGVDYKIWPITNEAIIEKFVNGMKNKTLVIADGHHRYKTALKYEKNHDGLDSKEVMVTLVNSKNPGMQIMPTHRIIRGIDLSITDIKKEVAHFFSYSDFYGVEKLLIEMDKANSEKNILGLYHRNSDTGLLLEFEAHDLLKSKMSDQSRELRELDTNILHGFLLKEVFKIDTNKQEDLKYLSYLRGNKSAIRMLDNDLIRLETKINMVLEFKEEYEKMTGKKLDIDIEDIERDKQNH